MNGKGRGVRHLIKNKTKKCFPGEVNVMGRVSKMILKEHLFRFDKRKLPVRRLCGNIDVEKE